MAVGRLKLAPLLQKRGIASILMVLMDAIGQCFCRCFDCMLRCFFSWLFEFAVLSLVQTDIYLVGILYCRRRSSQCIRVLSSTCSVLDTIFEPLEPRFLFIVEIKYEIEDGLILAVLTDLVVFLLKLADLCCFLHHLLIITTTVNSSCH